MGGWRTMAALVLYTAATICRQAVKACVAR